MAGLYLEPAIFHCGRHRPLRPICCPYDLHWAGPRPERTEFCLVKKHEREGVWVLKDLHKKGSKRKDGTHEHSILAKLYARRMQFGASRANLKFVSNIGVKLHQDQV